MTLPDEEHMALVYAREFLFDLLNPKATPNAPKAIRQRASDVLRHYPAEYRIEELTGIKRSPTQIRIFVKSIGMRLLKIDVVPSKADPDQPETYKKKLEPPRLEEVCNL